MKKLSDFSFLPGLLLLASLTLFSCKKEAQQSTTTIGESQNEVPDVPVTQRACSGTNFCEFSVRTTGDATLTVCGLVDGANTQCFCGCTVNDVGYLNFPFTAGIPVSFCVAKGTSFCICNSGTLVDITIGMDFGSGYVPVLIPAGSKACFSVTTGCVFTSITPC
jgi:hypothetical protein